MTELRMLLMHSRVFDTVSSLLALPEVPRTAEGQACKRSGHVVSTKTIRWPIRTSPLGCENFLEGNY
jgi:hypothetical protein